MRLLGGLLVTGLVLCAGAVRADDPAAARALVERGIKALGGEANLSKFKAATWKGKGKFSTGAGEVAYTGEWTIQPPDEFRASIEGEFNGLKFKRLRVIHGDKGWLKQDSGETEDLSPEAVAEARREMSDQWATQLLPLQTRAFTLAPLGESKVGDLAVVGLKVTTRDGRELRLFFDKETGLLLEADTVVKDAGKKVPQEVLYGDYKEVDGIKHARTWTVKRGGKVVAEQEITEYKPLEKADETALAKP